MFAHTMAKDYFCSKIILDTKSDLKEVSKVTSGVQYPLDQSDDLIFGSSREQCGGGCFSSEPQFEIDINEDDFNKLKNVYQNYVFEEYDTEEEEISKKSALKTCQKATNSTGSRTFT